MIRLQPGRWSRFSSGDLLAIYPAGDYRERLYSIGKIKKDIQLSVKLRPGGLGSGYLYNLAPETLFLHESLQMRIFIFLKRLRLWL